MEQVSGAMMIMLWLALLLTVKVGYVGMAVWLHAACPERMARTGALYRAHPWRCGLVGAVNGIVLFGAGLMLVSTGTLGPFGILLWCVIIVLSAPAYAAAYRSLGERLLEAPVASPRSVLLGGLTAEAAFCTPVLGQLASAGVLFRGLGAVILSQLRRDA